MRHLFNSKYIWNLLSVLSHIAFGHLDPIASWVVSMTPDFWDFLLDELKRLLIFCLTSPSPGEVGGSPLSDSPPDTSCFDEADAEPGLDVGGCREPVDLVGWRRTVFDVSN